MVKVYIGPIMEHYAEKERREQFQLCILCTANTKAKLRLWGQFFTRTGENIEARGIAVCYAHHSRAFLAWQRGALTHIDGREIVSLYATQRPL